MRVVQVVGKYAPHYDGVAYYSARLATALREVGVESAIASGETSAKCPVEFLAIRNFPTSVAGLVGLLGAARRWRADWLHVQFAPGAFDRSRLIGLLPILAKATPNGPRVAATMHEYGGWPAQPPRAIAPLANGLLSLGERAHLLDRESLTLIPASDRVIVTNSDHVDAIRKGAPWVLPRLTLVPIGPNVGLEDAMSSDRTDARRSLGVDDDRVVAVFFGFVHPVKGIETLLDAMAALRVERARIDLWIVGGVESLALRGAEAADYERQVRARIADLGLADNVVLTGFLPDSEVARRLVAADIAVLPFNRGATLKSGSLIACLRFGLPVIATQGGQLGELRHGENVWLVPPRDAIALAAALRTLSADPERRRRIGAVGAAIATQFDWTTIAAQHRELYLSGATREQTFGSRPRR